MTKQEALAILERNADPYLADPAEIPTTFGGNGLYLAVALTAFRKALAAFRADPDPDSEAGAEAIRWAQVARQAADALRVEIAAA